MNYDEARDKWQQALDLIHEDTEENSYNTWFKPLKLYEVKGTKVIVEAQDLFTLGLIRARFLTHLQNATSLIFGTEYEISVIGKHERPENRAEPEVNFNPKYTFDTFVVGASNRFAHAASLAVSEAPADAYNPLFLYGSAGLGKTHLMHAIGQYIQKRSPSTRICYVTSESFTNQLIDAISKKTQDSMRDRMRNVDVLMIDDIQFIAGKPTTQEEIFHTFNELHGNGKQIIISSDRPPKEISTLEERLRSRFEWGLIADIQKPDFETRVAILQRKADSEHLTVSDEVLHFIADKVDTNIRELEGALNRVSAMCEIDQRPITIENTQEVLSRVMGVRSERKMTPDIILQAVADYYHVSRDDLFSARRNREIAMPRQIAMFLTRELTELSTTRIGEFYGGRDHTTVMHACDKIGDQSKKDSALRDVIDRIKESARG